MSGRHAVVKPRRFRLTLLLVPARFVWRAARACLVGPAAGVRWLTGRVVAWAEARFDSRDPFADEPLTLVTSPDPIPAALPAPVEDAAPEFKPEPLRLTPREALASFHTVHPLLPAENLRWNLGADSVHGEVSSLDCSPAQQRKAVEDYADAFGTQWKERDAGDGHTLLTATGVHAGVTVIVTAVLLVDDTLPLRVYREATSTQETQAIPQEVLEQVMSA